MDEDEDGEEGDGWGNAAEDGEDSSDQRLATFQNQFGEQPEEDDSSSNSKNVPETKPAD